MAVPALEDLVAQVRKIALAFPNAVEKGGQAGAVEANFQVSNRNFARVLVMAHPDGREFRWLWLKTEGLERRTLLESGHPYFPASGVAVGIVLEASTDWDEVEELVTESYLLVAPKKLRAQVEASLSGDSE